jgi:hypothetical protein
MNARGKGKAVDEDSIDALEPVPDSRSSSNNDHNPPDGPSTSISMIAPLPHLPPAPSMLSTQALEDAEERWNRIAVLFQSVRERARSFSFPADSVHALESVLIRMYLESPIVPNVPQTSIAGIASHAIGAPQVQGQR